MAKTKPKTEEMNEYEVHVPMPYCEVYRVKAASRGDALKFVRSHKGTHKLNCIGEIASRRKLVKRIWPAKAKGGKNGKKRSSA